MGRLSLNIKSSPIPEQEVPPSYHDSRQSPLIVTETTTTRTQVITTTTERTTHFLSLSGWRKRDNVNHTSPQRPRHSGNIEENGDTTITTPLIQRDKALPPTPSGLLTSLPLNAPNHNSQIMAPREDVPRPNVPRPTTLLAQASLGLGLPHVVPRASSSSPSASEVNTVAFISASPSAEPTAVARRSKSSQRLNQTSATATSENEARRTRGMSLAPASFFGFNTADTKSKTDPLKSLSRKGSFWTRKKPDIPNLQTRPSTAHGDVSHRHSSMEVNLSDLPPPIPRQHKFQARDPLSRSCSERPQSYYPTINPEVPMSSPPDPVTPIPRRPNTANSTVPREQAQLPHRSGPGPCRTPSVSFSEAAVNEKLPIPRVRSQTNSPLLHRLSLNVFSSSTMLVASPTSSPTSPLLNAASEPLRKPVVIPSPMENGEPPDIYVSRLLDTVSKIEVTSILASSTEPFYVMALKAFIGRFDFVGDPLDIALRQLLLEIGLPKETQQIDRVMEAFAKRYIQCNSSLYVSEDHPYILAFSLIMLHTDAFNKSNKHKMTKPDYVKNTRLPGVAPEILEYLYDNIVFAPFIFIEDPLDFNGQRGLVTDTHRRSSAFRELPSMNPSHSSGAMMAIKTNKIDPYYMISNDLLHPLRINVEDHIPLSDPFSYEGTAEKWDEEELLLAFVNAHVVEVGSDTRSTPFFGLAAGGSSSPFVPTNSSIIDTYEELSTLRVTKVGVVGRKDDILEGGKKPIGRKWKSWGVVLTGSQLLFSKDPTWLNTLTNGAETNDGQFLIPQSAILKLDELLSLKNAIAVYDKSYTKHRFTFRLVLSDGRHLLLQASTENDMNQWISRINYASAFKSAGVRMRLASMSGRNMQLTGVAAATSHLHDLQNQMHSPSTNSDKWDDNAPQELLEMLSGDDPVSKRRPIQGKVTLRTNREEVELEASVPLEVEKSAEFKDTFDQVKADLAAETQARKGSELALPLDIYTPMTSKADLSLCTDSSLELLSPGSSSTGHPRLPSRSQIIEAKIAELGDRLIATESHLDTQMRFVRNVATLTPFQKATRDRLVVAVRARVRTVMQLRLDIARMRCHRSILGEDILAENRIWKEVKDIALRAAKETLQSRQSPKVPQMTLSMYDIQQELPGRALQIQRRQKSESSMCESFHTAIDFGPNWPSSDDLGSSLLGASRMLNSPRPSTSESILSDVSPEQEGHFRKSEATSVMRWQATHDVTQEGEEADPDHERFYTAQESLMEEAEAWDKTRCAKRVSLVRVPSTLELLPVSKRLTGGLSTTTEYDL